MSDRITLIHDKTLYTLAFQGNSFPAQLSRVGPSLQLHVQENVLDALVDQVYDDWSRYAYAHGQVSAGVNSKREEREALLKLALRASCELTNYLLGSVFSLRTTGGINYREEFIQWALSSSDHLIVENWGTTIPWHLLFVGQQDLKALNDFEVDEANFLLGIRRPITYRAILADDDDTLTQVENRQPFRGIPSNAMLTVGWNLPNGLTPDEMFDRITEELKSAIPSFQVPDFLASVRHHDQLGQRPGTPHEMWMVITHGEESQTRFRQRILRVEEGSHSDAALTNTRLRSYTRPLFALETPACIFLLSCRSGILGGGWDIPDIMFLLGASYVIAPHTNVDLEQGLSLMKRFLQHYSRDDVCPEEAYRRAVTESADLFSRIHDCLFTPIMASS